MSIGVDMEDFFTELLGLIVQDSRKWLLPTAQISSQILVHCLGSVMAGTVQPEPCQVALDRLLTIHPAAYRKALENPGCRSTALAKLSRPCTNYRMYHRLL
jgi:hypothetical protein